MSRYEDALIERHITLSPGARGPADARVADGVHVWALIGYLGAEAASDGPLTDEAIVTASADYALSRDAVKAAAPTLPRRIRACMKRTGRAGAEGSEGQRECR
jgi:hypothetical protein